MTSPLSEQPILLVLGPTASGKSALAHEVARHVGGEILAVDSMTVYCGMDLGTAKPTAEERVEVPYHGLDLVEPSASFTVARWLEEAERVIANTAERGVPLIACGGTPLYYQSLLRGMFEGPPADATFRSSLEGVAEAELHERLTAVDPVAAERLHVNDRKRLVRALEVQTLTGQTITDLQTQWSAGPDRLSTVRFALRWDRPDLNRRINARCKQMIEAGWLDEVRDLLATHGELSDTAREAAGYRLLAEHLAGRMKLDDAIEQIKIKTRQLAKRQMTWFRRFENVTWLPGDGDFEENVAQMLQAFDR